MTTLHTLSTITWGRLQVSEELISRSNNSSSKQHKTTTASAAQAVIARLRQTSTHTAARGWMGQGQHPLPAEVAAAVEELVARIHPEEETKAA